MTTIDQLRLSTLASAYAGQNGYTGVTSTTGAFKDVLDSVSAPQNLDNIFSEASTKYGVPEKLLKAVAKAESNFNPQAVSNKGAIGIMQLMPKTAKALGVENPYDARSNIMGGAKYLRENLDKYKGNVELTLAAYNAGSNNVKKYGGIPPFKETQNYVKKVKGYMGEPISAGYITSSGVGKSGNTSFLDALKSFSNLTSESTESDLATNKSNYLYLIELMKIRMQMASYSISGQMNSNDLNSESLYNL